MAARRRASTDKKDDERYAARYPAGGPRPPVDVAEEDARLAADAIEAGHARAAMRPLAGALWVDPTREEWLALLERALDTLGFEDVLASALDAEPWVAIDGLRAYAAHHRGALDDALDHLMATARNGAAARYLELWAPEWLAIPGAIERLGAKPATDVLYAIAAGFPDPPHVSAEAARVLGEALPLVDRVEAAHGPTDASAIVRGMMLARAGRVAEAIAVTEARARAVPTTMSLTAAGMAHRRAGDLDTAIAWLEKAAAHAPTYVPCLLDIGDWCVEEGRLGRALAAYEEALRRDPTQDWALPSREYCRYQLEADPAALAALRGMANGARCTCGGASALAALTGGYSYDDRQRRALALMRKIEPGFVPRPVEIVH